LYFMLQFILIMLNAFRFLGLFCGWVCLTFAQIDSYSIFPVAGIARPTGDGGPAAAALLNQPRGVAVDAAGNTYFSDQQNHRVRKIDKSGIITTFAGTGIRGTAGDGGPAANAQLISPYGLAFGKAGDLYIADHDANIIRKVAADGTMSTIAGIAGLSGYSGDGGLSTTAKLNSPFDVAVDISGNLYIADAGNSRVRKVTPAGIITTAVGNGNLDFTATGGPGPQISIAFPEGLAFDSTGNLYISEWGYARILKMNSAGAVTIFAGTGYFGSDGDSGPAGSATFIGPTALAVDATGTVYVADSDNHRVRKINTGGIITTVSGTGKIGSGGDGFSAGAAQLFSPSGLAVDSSGNLLIGDTGNHRLRKVVVLSNLIGTVAGGSQSIGDGGPAASAVLFSPNGVAVDTAFNVYIADQFNHRVRKVTPAGVISTVAGTGAPGYSGDGGPAISAQLFYPLGVALDPQGNLLVADTNNNRIRRIGSNGVIQTIAGNGRNDFAGDGGPATLAALSLPTSARSDAAGNLYIADTFNSRIRKINVGGTINTFAGSNSAQTGDGGPAAAAGLLLPTGVAIDAANNVYIADGLANRVRKVNAASGLISTVAGNGNFGFAGDGGQAAAAALFLPQDVAVDATGNLYIVDTGNARIRKVTPAGIVTTIAGTGGYGVSDGGGLAAQADIGFPIGVAVDTAGVLYFADSDNHRVRKLVRQAAVQDFSLTADAKAVSVNRGATALVTLSVLSAGFSGPVTLAAKGFSTGSVAFAPSAPVTLAAGQCSAVRATISFPASTPAGVIPVTFTADSGTLHHEISVSLTIVDVPLIAQGGIVSAAGYNKGAVSPGEIVTIFGAGIGPAALVGLQIDAAGKVASALGGVTVTFDGHAAPLIYVSATQISAIVPYAVAGLASTQLQIQYLGTASSSMTVPVTDAVPALFTADSSGTGAAAILNQDNSVNTSGNPAAKGSIVVIFGTGEGQTLPGGADGAIANSVFPKPVLPVSVSVGGLSADVLYAGAAPGQVAGLIQVNVRIPDGTLSGAVPIALTIGTRTSGAGLTVAVQ
jgi:uncharacterized protein (TIGR03437 family)